MFTVSIMLPNQDTLESAVGPQQISAIDKHDAADWFGTAFDALGCNTPNPTSKLLPRHMVAQIAMTAAEKGKFADTAWREVFAVNCAAYFRRKIVSINVGEMQVTTSED